jgi:hypothetical protein
MVRPKIKIMRKFLFSIMALLLVLGTAMASSPPEEPNDRVSVDVNLQVDNFVYQDVVRVVDLRDRDVYQIERVNALPTERVIEGYSTYFGTVNDVGKGTKRNYSSLHDRKTTWRDFISIRAKQPYFNQTNWNLLKVPWYRLS